VKVSLPAPHRSRFYPTSPLFALLRPVLLYSLYFGSGNASACAEAANSRLRTVPTRPLAYLLY
jgi:hypothetical protein